MPYYIYNNHKIYYEESGDGMPLLLLHGNTASSKMFGGIASKYADKFKVILIDFLGYGMSDRVEALNEDLWYDEAMQIVCFLKYKCYKKVDVIGTSGGALAAINLALEEPDLVNKLIADSFEGESADLRLAENLKEGREASKRDAGTVMFYKMMNGDDWKSVVDKDTKSVMSHAENIVNYFHKSISDLKSDFLFTGSDEDEFVTAGFYEDLFSDMIEKAGHGRYHIFNKGDHPAMLSNKDDFIKLSLDFLGDN